MCAKTDPCKKDPCDPCGGGGFSTLPFNPIPNPVLSLIAELDNARRQTASLERDRMIERNRRRIFGS
jgi:hypothetical protein